MTTKIKEVNLKAIVAKAEDDIKKDHKHVDPVILATYCWTPMAYYDMRDLEEGCRVREAMRLVQQGFDLESEAFKFLSKLEKVPTKEQSAKRITYITKLEQDCANAMGRPCDRSLAGALRDMLGRFDDLYSALEGLAILDGAQDEGKIVQWAKVYGTSGAPYGPMQVGGDWKELIRAAIPGIRPIDESDKLQKVYEKAKSDDSFASGVFADPIPACEKAGIYPNRTEIKILGDRVKEARKYFLERLLLAAQHINAS